MAAITRKLSISGQKAEHIEVPQLISYLTKDLILFDDKANKSAISGQKTTNFLIV